MEESFTAMKYVLLLTTHEFSGTSEVRETWKRDKQIVTELVTILSFTGSSFLLIFYIET
jgi:hypothetical protein